MSVALSAVDASSLIVLAKVGRLDLLTTGGYQVMVTETVYQEVLAGAPKDPERQLTADLEMGDIR